MEDNARYYLAATNEIEQGRINEQVWAKAIALEGGDAKRAKYTYVQLRVKQFEQAMAKSGSTRAAYTQPGGEDEGAAPAATIRESGATPPADTGQNTLTSVSDWRSPTHAPGASGPPLSPDGHQPERSARTQTARATDAPDVDNIQKAIRQFNWGAALLPFFWSIFNTRGWYWAAALAGNLLIPWVGWLVTGIVFGVFGSRWSWASKDWDSFQVFERSQSGWTIGGILVTVTLLLLGVLMAGAG